MPSLYAIGQGALLAYDTYKTVQEARRLFTKRRAVLRRRLRRVKRRRRR